METFVVGAGPSELHAHIDLDHRVSAIAAPGLVSSVRVMAASECDGQWSVVAAVSFELGKGGA